MTGETLQVVTTRLDQTRTIGFTFLLSDTSLSVYEAPFSNPFSLLGPAALLTKVSYIVTFLM